ncbi:glycosyltransferase [Thalassolituus hydrocarboniclasticus]|uniref:Glycosyltransferase n=1 Tax=Thalassolituus hydrocarboniclasticus TaxID=2742796 RepID=A0ABY6AB35_9GAMM|nr:glycosyltransferase [Thalassolituus hydrocarboniclasticus]UXD87947.1 glycosyltransferase [Thalassolituus hydrocarboniclasticus]
MSSIFHITTVHKRHDIRIYLKELISLSRAYDSTLIVFDGHGNDDDSVVKIVDLGERVGNRLFRVFSHYRGVIAYLADIKRTVVSSEKVVVHFHDPENLILAYILTFKGFKVIWDSHEDFPRQLLYKMWLPVLIRKPLSSVAEIIENFVSKRIAGVVAATPLIESRFKSINNNTVCVKNYPILDEFLDLPVIKEGEKVICYIGSINVERGIVELMDALGVLGPEYKLILCGTFDSPNTERLVNSHCCWSQVDFRGMLGREGVRKALSESNVGMVTLHPSPNQVEALPIKLFEYMAAGVPVIASNFPLWETIVNESSCGKVVDPYSVDEIVDAIKSICGNVGLARSYGESGRAAVMQKYSWESEEKKLLEFYKDIIQ